jgi:hypothetical protein
MDVKIHFVHVAMHSTLTYVAVKIHFYFSVDIKRIMKVDNPQDPAYFVAEETQ